MIFLYWDKSYYDDFVSKIWIYIRSSRSRRYITWETFKKVDIYRSSIIFKYRKNNWKNILINVLRKFFNWSYTYIMHVNLIAKISHEFLRDRMKNHVKRLQSWKKFWQILKLVSSSNSNWQCRNYHFYDSYKKWHVFQISSLVLLLRKWFKISMISLSWSMILLLGGSPINLNHF